MLLPDDALAAHAQAFPPQLHDIVVIAPDSFWGRRLQAHESLLLQDLDIEPDPVDADVPLYVVTVGDSQAFDAAEDPEEQ
jgi:hypothetical protein